MKLNFNAIPILLFYNHITKFYYMILGTSNSNFCVTNTQQQNV